MKAFEKECDYCSLKRKEFDSDTAFELHQIREVLERMRGDKGHD